MCCCGKPIVNGEFRYKWQPNDAPGVRESDPPELRDGDELVYDEPGRCGASIPILITTGLWPVSATSSCLFDTAAVRIVPLLAPRRCSPTLLQPLIQRSGTGYSMPSTTPTETANAVEPKNRTPAGGRLLLTSASRSVGSRIGDREGVD